MINRIVRLQQGDAMNEKVNLPEFQQASQALAHAGSLSDPSEAHGMLCGMLCTNNAMGGDAWLKQIMGDATQGQVLAKEGEERDMLLGLFAATVYQLEDPELNFTLLLPDDEVSLDRRVEFLAHWCQGFLFGLGVGGMEQTRKMPDDVREFLNDLTAISEASFDAEQSNDEDELAYAEVVEYVRLGVLLINELLQPPPATNPDPQLH